MTKTIHIEARAYGMIGNAHAKATAYVYEGNDLIARAELVDEHLIIFNCIGALRVEGFIEAARALHPGIEITLTVTQKPEIGEIVSGFARDVNRAIASKQAA